MKTSYLCNEVTEMLLLLAESAGANPATLERAKHYKYTVSELFSLVNTAIVSQGDKNLSLKKALKTLEKRFYEEKQESLFPEWIERAPENFKARYKEDYLEKLAKRSQ